jgi:broad specificity phosphatase PhoE
LIRHGQYISNPSSKGMMQKEQKDEVLLTKQEKDFYARTKDANPNCVLTDLGREQASLTGERVKNLLESGVLFPIKKLYYSTMAR